MEDGDEEALALWRRFRDLSIVKYKETYARLNVAFDVYSGESQVNAGMLRALAMLKEQGLLEESEGAKIIDLEADKLGKAIVEKKDGTALYITRDIGAAMERWETYKFDKMYYVVAAAQELHLRQLFAILKKLNFDWASRCEHISFGLVTGMSTRKGTAVFLDDILEETRERMHEQMRQNEKKYAQIEDPVAVADQIGLSAIMVQDMAARRIKNYEFKWDRMFSFEGDTGPYLQYAHARLCSVERNLGRPVNPQANLALVTEKPALEIVELIAKYPEVVRNACTTLEPSNIVQYSLKLSHAVSVAWDTIWVMNQPEELADARMWLYWSARIVLGNALKLIGLKPLERM